MGIAEEIPVRVSLHQGSSLSPQMFIFFLNGTVEKIKEVSPWTMLFAGDIVLVDDRKLKC